MIKVYKLNGVQSTSRQYTVVIDNYVYEVVKSKTNSSSKKLFKAASGFCPQNHTLCNSIPKEILSMVSSLARELNDYIKTQADKTKACLLLPSQMHLIL